MKNEWTNVALGEVIERRENFCTIFPEIQYKEVTVSLWGRGVRLRKRILGSEISAAKRNQASSGDFIISKIDARHGAYGFIPNELEGAVVSNDFPLFRVNSEVLCPRWLYWVSKSRFFIDLCVRASKGTTNRVRLKESLFLNLVIPLPPLFEQQRLVAGLDSIEVRLNSIQKLRDDSELELLAALRSAFHKLEAESELLPMGEVAPLVRREVPVESDVNYPELGIRSFGKGTFHKPPVLGIETTKRLFEIHEGDLVFNNVFAWEGAVAVAQTVDNGRVGSHRFITCVCNSELVLPEILQFYFLTAAGLEKISQASPGGAGRNRTLGIKKLERILVPIPPIEQQYDFLRLLKLRQSILKHRAKAHFHTEAVIPSILDRILNC